MNLPLSCIAGAFDTCEMTEDILLWQTSWLFLTWDLKVKSVALCANPFGFWPFCWLRTLYTNRLQAFRGCENKLSLNFQLFAWNIEGGISFQKTTKCLDGKSANEPYFCIFNPRSQEKYLTHQAQNNLKQKLFVPCSCNIQSKTLMLTSKNCKQGFLYLTIGILEQTWNIYSPSSVRQRRWYHLYQRRHHISHDQQCRQVVHHLCFDQPSCEGPYKMKKITAVSKN